ncbi:MAG: ABC transporter substrate-binding protein [Candidatus Binatia bacterium]
MIRSKHSLIVGVFWLVASLPLTTFAQDARLIEAAKKEGVVAWYTGSNLVTMRAVADVFEQKYAPIKVQVTQSNSERLVNRVRAEKATGKLLFDVVNASLAPLLVPMGAFTPYDSPERKAYGAKFKDAQNLWTSITSNYFVIGRHTKFVSRAEAPKDWPGLLQPKWKGKFGMDPEEYDWLAAMREALGDEKAGPLMKALAQQDIQWHKGHTQVLQLLVAGEFPLALVYAHSLERLKEKGAPLEWVRTTKPIVASTSMIGVSAQAAHPNAARLLVDFILAKEGQSMILKYGSVPARPDVLPKDSALSPAGLELQPVSASNLVNLDEQARKFEEWFGPRR